MSLNYTEKCMVHGSWSTPNDGDVLLVIPASAYDYYVLGIEAIATTAGVVAAAGLDVETYAASPVAITSVTVGTTAARGTVRQLCPQATRLVSAGTPIAVTWNTNEGTGVGQFILHLTSTLG